MIRTDKQLRITKEKIAEFEKAHAELEKKKGDIDEFEYKLEESGIISVLGKLKADAKEYEELSNEKCKSRILSFEIRDFPDMLIKARLVRKMTQTELAKKIEVEPQAIHRYEANGYAGVGFERLLQIQYALDIEAQCEVQMFDNSIFNIDGYSEEEVIAKEEKMLTGSIFQS